MNIGKEKSPGGTWGGRQQGAKTYTQGVAAAGVPLSAVYTNGYPTRMRGTNAPFSLFTADFSAVAGNSGASAFRHG